MNKKVIGVIAVAVVVLIALFAYLFLNKESPVSGKILAITGLVEVHKKEASKPVKVFEDMAFTEGDTLFTRTDGRAHLAIDANKEVEVAPETELAFTELTTSVNAAQGKTHLELKGGKVKIKISEKLEGDSKFQIETPNAIMGVMGTEFYVYYDENGTWVGVIEGQVNIVKPNGEHITLLPGDESVFIGHDGEIEFRELTPEQEELFYSQAFEDGNSDSTDVVLGPSQSEDDDDDPDASDLPIVPVNLPPLPQGRPPVSNNILDERESDETQGLDNVLGLGGSNSGNGNTAILPPGDSGDIPSGVNGNGGQNNVDSEGDLAEDVGEEQSSDVEENGGSEAGEDGNGEVPSENGGEVAIGDNDDETDGNESSEDSDEGEDSTGGQEPIEDDGTNVTPPPGLEPEPQPEPEEQEEEKPEDELGDEPAEGPGEEPQPTPEPPVITPEPTPQPPVFIPEPQPPVITPTPNPQPPALTPEEEAELNQAISELNEAIIQVEALQGEVGITPEQIAELQEALDGVNGVNRADVNAVREVRSNLMNVMEAIRDALANPQPPALTPEEEAELNQAINELNETIMQAEALQGEPNLTPEQIDEIEVELYRARNLRQTDIVSVRAAQNNLASIMEAIRNALANPQPPALTPEEEAELNQAISELNEAIIQVEALQGEVGITPEQIAELQEALDGVNGVNRADVNAVREVRSNLMNVMEAIRNALVNPQPPALTPEEEAELNQAISELNETIMQAYGMMAGDQYSPEQKEQLEQAIQSANQANLQDIHSVREAKENLVGVINSM